MPSKMKDKELKDTPEKGGVDFKNKIVYFHIDFTKGSKNKD